MAGHKIMAKGTLKNMDGTTIGKLTVDTLAVQGYDLKKFSGVLDKSYLHTYIKAQSWKHHDESGSFIIDKIGKNSE